MLPVIISTGPTYSTKDHQASFFNWFLNVAVKRRVLAPDLGMECPKADIMKVQNSEFLPTRLELENLEENFIFHIVRIIVEYVDCLKPLAPSIPEHIQHPYLEETSSKSEAVVLGWEKNENDSGEIIDILQWVHDNFVPFSCKNGLPAEVVEPIFFTGDVLTNERAYTGQLAMINALNDYDRIQGVIHRPEGLHRIMNLLLLIYQIFYKEASQEEKGTLCQLRNFVNRRDVTGSKGVTDKFRAHYAFLEDSLKAHVVAGCLDILGIDETEGKPGPGQGPTHMLQMADKEVQYTWLYNLGKAIHEQHVKGTSGTNSVVSISKALDKDEEYLQSHYDGAQYLCECGKRYKMTGWFRQHLEKIHKYPFTNAEVQHSKAQHSRLFGSGPEIITKKAFMKCALLLVDTNDGYKMGDGDRIFRNAKLEMLLDAAQGHTKYRLWLWRLMAYENTILPPRLAFEYKWNTTVNLSGGIGHNIPYDNLVEITVHRVKEKLRAQGANVTFNSARDASMSTQIADEVKSNLIHQFHSHVQGRKKTVVDRSGDIKAMVSQLQLSKFFSESGQSADSFEDFKDPYDRVNVADMHTWINKQKKQLWKCIIFKNLHQLYNHYGFTMQLNYV